MSVLENFRQENPIYKDTPNGQLAFGLWNTHYKDKLGMGEFADRVDLSQDDFGQMIAFGKGKGHDPTARVSDPSIDTGEIGTGGTLAGTARAVSQGFLGGGSDEVIAGLASVTAKAIGDERPLSQIYDEIQSEESQRLKQFRESDPALAYGGEITGSIISPLAKVTRVGQFTKMGVTGKTALDSAAFAMPYAFLAQDGSVTDRVSSAGAVAVPAMLFGAAGQKMVQISKPMFDKFMGRSFKVPTIENLRSAKNEAYKLVSDSGEVFKAAEINQAFGKIVSDIQKTGSYVPKTDTQVDAAFDILARSSGKDLTLSQLDRMRQNIWKRHGKADGAQKQDILTMVNAIDDLIESSVSSSGVMNVARLANARYKKSELLDDAFQNVVRSGEVAGGGNQVQRYKSAVKQILSNPSKSRWFDSSELEAMNKLVSGDLPEKVLRQIGRLSPEGSSLMSALSITATIINPIAGAVALSGVAGKHLSEAGIKKQATSLEALIRGAQIKAPEQAKVIAPLIGSTLEQRNR